MNIEETVRALLDGKRIRMDYHNPGVFFVLRKQDGTIRNQDGDEIHLLGALPRGEPNIWLIYVEPNPHTKSTFAWAREEAKRGRRVKRAVHVCFATAKDFRPHVSWTLESIDATDWEVEP